MKFLILLVCVVAYAAAVDLKSEGKSQFSSLYCMHIIMFFVYICKRYFILFPCLEDEVGLTLEKRHSHRKQEVIRGKHEKNRRKAEEKRRKAEENRRRKEAERRRKQQEKIRRKEESKRRKEENKRRKEENKRRKEEEKRRRKKEKNRRRGKRCFLLETQFFLLIITAYT